jgi:outer membrane protein assembly factor BamB
MKTMKRLGVMGAVVLLGASAVMAEDWPQWRGANRDAKVAGFKAPAAWPATLTPKWKVTVGSGDATPALVGEKLYVFVRQDDNEVTLCLNATDGQKIWEEKYPAAAVTGAAARHPGPRSSPAVADGKVVTLGVGGVLSCLDASTGVKVWRNEEYKTVPQFFTSTSPIIVDGMAIAHLGGKGKGAMLALGLADGKEKWKWEGDAPGYSSPVVLTAGGTKQIVEETEKMVVGVNAADGKLLWQIPFQGQRMSNNAPTPVVDGETVFFTGNGRGTRAVKVEKQGDAFTAKELWSNPQLATQWNTPVLKDGYLYGISERGNLFCINARDGKTAWTDSNRLSAFGEVVDAGSVLLALSEQGDLIVFKPDPAKLDQVAKIKVSQSQTYSYPVLSGNKLYIKDQQSLMMYTIE